MKTLPRHAQTATRFERPLPRIGEIKRAFATQHEQRLQTSVGESRAWLLIANTAITSAGHRLESARFGLTSSSRHHFSTPTLSTLQTHWIVRKILSGLNTRNIRQPTTRIIYWTEASAPDRRPTAPQHGLRRSPEIPLRQLQTPRNITGDLGTLSPTN
jgi:hypothetical protein